MSDEPSVSPQQEVNAKSQTLKKNDDFSKPSYWENNDLNQPIEPRFFQEFIRMLFALGFIIVLIFVAAWIFKRILNQRLKQINITSEIKILERRSLSPKTSVYLLEVMGKGVLIGESPAGIQRLGDIALSPQEKHVSFGDIYKEKQPKQPKIDE